MRRVLKILTNNWWLKLLALAMAWLLWSVVTQGPPVETGMLVSFGIRHLPADLEIDGELPTPVYVQLRGPERLVEGLRPEEVGVTVELADARPGERGIVLLPKHVRVPNGIEVVRFIPAEVQLHIVKKEAAKSGKRP